ncbi:hypothetical protein ACFWBX_12450 [Streptomyces sp. NPDC059991]|uniref:hypothetical protein n=1 Tax=Streptomyces sp. NPDC059991 TaxID=3347028 RepID=UPI0036C0BD8A
MSSAQEFSPMARSRQVRDRSVGVAPSKASSLLALRRTPLARCRVIDLMRVGRTLCC